MKSFKSRIIEIVVFIFIAFLFHGCTVINGPTTLFSDDFESYAAGSPFPEGNWTDMGYGQHWSIVKDTAFTARSQVVSGSGYWGGAYIGDNSWDNYKVSALVRSGSYNAIVARYESGSSCYVLAYSNSSNQLFISKGIGGTTLAIIALTVDISAYHKLTLEVNGGTLTGFVDDVKKITCTDATPITNGPIGLYGAGTWYDNVLVMTL